MMRDILEHLFSHHTLTRQEACDILKAMAAQRYEPTHMAAFLTVFRMRSITVDELEGFRDAMFDLCLRVDLSDFPAVDLCGTGGDGKDTFNISTLAAFVVAACGIFVIKHGNYGVSSISGSSNVLQELGATFTQDVNQLKRQLEQSGFCYLHAPLFHPAMKHIAPIRKELRFRTFFNMLGPLVNPASPSSQLVGVFSLELARLYGYLLQRKSLSFCVVHSFDGYDEISLTGAWKMISSQGEYLLDPHSIGMAPVQPDDLFGGQDVASAAALFLRVLQGEGTPEQHRVVIANAAFAIRCSRPSISIADALDMARDALFSGKAKQTFQRFLAVSSSLERNIS